MKRVFTLLLVSFALSCSTYISNSDQNAIEEVVRNYYSVEQPPTSYPAKPQLAFVEIFGIRIKRNGEKYVATVDGKTADGKRETRSINCRYYFKENGNYYWKAENY